MSHDNNEQWVKDEFDNIHKILAQLGEQDNELGDVINDNTSAVRNYLAVIDIQQKVLWRALNDVVNALRPPPDKIFIKEVEGRVVLDIEAYKKDVMELADQDGIPKDQLDKWSESARSESSDYHVEEFGGNYGQGTD
jgi:hypothetical protein